MFGAIARLSLMDLVHFFPNHFFVSKWPRLSYHVFLETQWTLNWARSSPRHHRIAKFIAEETTTKKKKSWCRKAPNRFTTGVGLILLNWECVKKNYIEHIVWENQPILNGSIERPANLYQCYYSSVVVVIILTSSQCLGFYYSLWFLFVCDLTLYGAFCRSSLCNELILHTQSDFFFSTMRDNFLFSPIHSESFLVVFTSRV